MFYKITENGYITMIGSPNVPTNGEAITAEKHAELSETIKNKPEDTFKAVYRLSAETEQYVPCERNHEETVAWYVEKVNSGEMTLEEVPEDYRAEVEAIITPQPSDDYTAGYDQAVLDMIESGVL